ncbi:Translation elongation factor EF-Ts, mitochondrial [Chondrus crispus]|uniref:Elongation factor Ts, mitochondrial n=1 Tax=Chondrus crispus TaxID=2769 RepID=R7QD59_CHOCR|nr:Translation elongation factor EF-Ts, mitochondrial [Chondrus crispus]CDF35718.1 Translation elongation factor EF-Ts, mitochondrial [Chondrus crispus]|eukprot:XP_005715537.1 Translation elongation factor EF-Ts, mitochondrial [Chondrus crispus]
MHAIKELRKRTGAPIGAVKKALDEEKGDMEAAIVYLRKIGASIAAKKAHRDASEGLIGIAISPDKSRASIIEVNSETDFVARTPQFVQLVNRLTESALNKGRVADCNTMISLDTQQLLEQDENKEMVLGAVSSLGENIVLKRANVMTLDSASGALFGYTHGSAGIGSGRIGALVALKGGTLNEAGPRMAMHIAAAAPSYISIGSIPPQDLERERSILLEAALAEQKAGDKPKPPAILERMAHGRLRKWYASSVLEEQEMLVDNPSYSGEPRAVKEFLKKETADSEIVAMCRMVVGEK